MKNFRLSKQNSYALIMVMTVVYRGIGGGASIR